MWEFSFTNLLYLIPLYRFLMRQFEDLTTTAIYLRMSGQEAKEILREKGLI